MGPYHPQVVHFAVALVFVGVGFRLLSLLRRATFANTAAPVLIGLGTIACFAAVETGTAAHGPVERAPGVRPAVVEHEAWGERTRNMFTVVSVIELGAYVLYRRQHRARFAAALTATAVGLAGLVMMYETAEHGGELVYAYGGGVGIRSGEPEDVQRAFVTATYQQALQDRASGRGGEAMGLLDLAAARFPDHLDLQLLRAEWTTEVQRDPATAIQRLDALAIPRDNTRARVRAGLARAGALSAQNNPDGARAVLQTLLGEFPENAQVKRRLEEMGAPPR